MSELVQETPAAAALEQGAEASPAARRTRLVPIGAYFGPRLWMAVIVFASAMWVAFASPPARAILAPALVMADASAIFILVIYRRDRRLPVFEIGSLWVFITLLYSVFPLLNYYAGGLKWTVLSDGRLQSYYDVSPYETGAFSWRYVVYLVPFTITYLLVRGRAHVGHTRMNTVARSRVAGIVIVFIACKLMLLAVERIYGVSYDASYVDIVANNVDTIRALPYFLQQVIHNVLSIRFLLVQIMLLIAIHRWHDWKYRVVVFGFFAWEIGSTLYIQGARSELVLLLVTAVLMYHRLVRPLTIKFALPIAAGILLAFNALGIIRDMRGLGSLGSNDVPFLAAGNEFQAVWATSFDIYMRKQLGTLGPAPWQIPFSDLYFMVPSQLLPFEKIDPSEWYLQQAGFENVGLMFGAVSHGIVGYDWKDLVIRSLLLGLIAAMAHRWYVRRAERFWPTVFYMFICVWTYYSMRQSSLAVLSFIEYWFFPAFLSVELVSLLLRRARKKATVLIRG